MSKKYKLRTIIRLYEKQLSKKSWLYKEITSKRNNPWFPIKFYQKDY